jgi:O-antigen/teichoic acid export membrane protein
MVSIGALRCYGRCTDVCGHSKVTRRCCKTVSAPTQIDEQEHPVVARLARDITLAEGARQGGAWIGAAQAASQVFQFAISIITARLLLPSQFGEAALVFAVASFAQIFTDLGLSAAIVHARRVTEDLLCSAFWLNAGTGLGLTLLFSALAVPISMIYGEPRLVSLLILASLNFTLACGGVQIALLERSFNFRRLAIIETVTNVIGLITVPIAAVAGLGVYSLLLGPLLTTATLSAALWLDVRWWPSRGASRAALRQLWNFSRGLVGFNAVNYWSRNVDNLLLGAAVSTSELGKYSRSYNLMLIPVGQISIVMTRVLYPALARMRDEPARMARAWSRAVSATAGTLALPLTLTMAATAPAFVHVVYGPRWTGMVPVLEILSLAAVPQIIGAATGGPYRAADRTGLLFRLGTLITVITVLAIAAGLPWGITGVAVAILINSWLCLPLVVSPLARIWGVPTRRLLLPIVTASGPGLLIAAGELAVRFAVPSETRPSVVLALQLLVGGGLYVAAMWRSDSELAQAGRARITQLVTQRRRVSSSQAKHPSPPAEPTPRHARRRPARTARVEAAPARPGRRPAPADRGGRA